MIDARSFATPPSFPVADTDGAAFPLNGIRLYDSFISGATNVIRNERILNRINVFPVPDGDTGTNLAMTMRPILRGAIRAPEAGRTMHSISRAARENACGNSGLIFAQYLEGLAEGMSESVVLSPAEFAAAAGLAAQRAHGAVAAPKEGTILTVMHAWAEDIAAGVRNSPFLAAFERSVETASRMVEQTKTMMKVLRENNVVDSGAKGFLLFLEGMLTFIRSGVPVRIDDAQTMEDPPELHLDVASQVLENRYCSQFVLEGDVPDEALKALLAPHGDSIVIASSKPAGPDAGGTSETSAVVHRIHLHCDHPDEVMRLLGSRGQVTSHKVDDMRLQADTALRRKRSIGIVTDSIADLPEGFADREQVVVLPLNIICDGTAYLDRLTMTPALFWREIDGWRMNPTSAQPSSIAIERTFAWMQMQYDSILAIFVSGRMSGLAGTAAKVAERLSANGTRIAVVDTKQNSAAEGLLVLEAVRMASEGVSLDEIAGSLRQMSARARIFVSVDTLRYMLRGGRVPKFRSFLLSRLNLRPVVSIDAEGRGSVFAKTFTRTRAISRILTEFRGAVRRGLGSYGIVYADRIEDVEGFRNQLEALAGFPPAFVSPISPVVGLNAGRGAIAVAYLERGRS